MKDLRLGKSVRRVTVLGRDGNGQVAPTVIFERQSGKRKNSKLVGPVNKAIRRLMAAEQAFTSSYLARHDESNRARKDGWLRDGVVNLVHAGRKGSKQLKISRWIVP